MISDAIVQKAGVQMPDTLNGYPFSAIDEQVFSKLQECTASSIQASIARFRDRLSEIPVDSPPIPVSLGENCGPGIKIRDADQSPLGAMFFDNLVCPISSTIELFKEDFRGILSLQNLRVSKWEGSDSVFDDRYGVYYHHYFHLRPQRMEKSWYDNGIRRRRIDEADIPLFLPVVASQFAYLTEKLRLLLRSEHHTTLYLRRVEGEVVGCGLLSSLAHALKSWGAVNSDIRVIYSDRSIPEHHAPEAHYYIPEVGGRWGDVSRWKEVFVRA